MTQDQGRTRMILPNALRGMAPPQPNRVTGAQRTQIAVGPAPVLLQSERLADQAEDVGKGSRLADDEVRSA